MRGGSRRGSTAVVRPKPRSMKQGGPSVQTQETIALFGAVLASEPDGIRNAIQAGANLDEWDANGMTPLLYAVYRGDTRAVELLLQAGADPNRGHRGDLAATPLWHAVDDFGLFEVAALLREAGAVAGKDDRTARG